ncbi:GntR family transcriptional regulator [Aliivibrio kagoshimensis]|uniref:GntR family transcriptional regulator n=1 Tax=Aliivibrio kagoshimensis TaxID=2910230 RepID=UPI003D0DFCB2
MSSPTLTDKVSKMIRQDILTGQLLPGQKLVVADLKSRYAVGASPIREALVQLSSDKYVKFKPQKGCWVSPVSVDELTEIFESLRIVGRFLLEKSIQSGNEDWELKVLTSYHKLSRSLQTNLGQDLDIKLDEWDELHRQFHSALLSGSDSKIMFSFYLDLVDQLKRYDYILLNKESIYIEHAKVIEDHEIIMKAAFSGDTAKALEKLDAHSEDTLELLKKYINS